MLMEGNRIRGGGGQPTEGTSDIDDVADDENMM